jgi:L-ascorbate metabolism protein UlaG (beta-lactamase superfamily)
MRNRYYSGPVSDHFDGVRFFNPGQPSTDRTVADIWRWRRTSRPAPWPRRVSVEPVRPPDRSDALRVTLVGHATCLIQAAGLNLLTDPVWSDRASPVGFAGPRRVIAPGIDFDDLPPIDAVLLSHCHYDHMDEATLRRLHAVHRPLFVMPLGNDALVRRWMPDARIATGDWGDTLEIGNDASVTLTPALHWSARGIRDRRMALWSGHYLTTAAGRVWFAGDTGYGDGAPFRAIRATLGPPDLALIPIGAYAPRWFMGPQHCDPAEAVRILREVGARRALAIHWGCFQLTDEARDEPPALLSAALANAGIASERFVAVEPGGTLTV